MKKGPKRTVPSTDKTALTVLIVLAKNFTGETGTVQKNKNRLIIGRFVRVWSIILETPLATLESGGSGVKTRGAGEGMPFKQGEEGAGEFSRKGGLLRTSFSGESTSLSPI